MATSRLIPGLLATLLLVATSSPDLHAQTTFGVRGGVTVSSLDGDLGQTFEKSNRTGFAGGVFLDFGGSNPLGLQIGAEYIQRGVEFDTGFEDFSLNYLEIPAVVKLGVPLGGLKPSLLGGAALGFQTSCENGPGFDCDEEITSTEFAGLLGADVAFYLGGLTLFVDGRYHFGLNDISDAADFDELKNRAWTFQGGIGFPLGG